MIWKKQFSLAELENLQENTLDAHLGIEFVEIGDNYLTARMPVDARTVQPYGLLHGGASVCLAETLGSVAALMACDEGCRSVGLEINANHIRPARKGFVEGRAEPLHLGQTTQVWQIEIRDEKDHLTCISRITVAILSSSEK